MINPILIGLVFILMIGSVLFETLSLINEHCSIWSAIMYLFACFIWLYLVLCTDLNPIFSMWFVVGFMSKILLKKRNDKKRNKINDVLDGINEDLAILESKFSLIKSGVIAGKYVLCNEISNLDVFKEFEQLSVSVIRNYNNLYAIKDKLSLNEKLHFIELFSVDFYALDVINNKLMTETNLENIQARLLDYVKSLRYANAEFFEPLLIKKRE